jgi:hypothetical protein
VPRDKPLNRGEGLDEDLAHFFTLEVATREYKRTYSGLDKSSEFRAPVTDSVVLRKDQPPLSPDLSEPLFIPRVWAKVVIMNMYFNASLTECNRNYLLA